MPGIEWKETDAVWETHHNVIAVWAFGSAQDGQIPQGGDLDIGVFFEAPPSLDELADLRSDLQQALGFEEIDLVVLNRANPVLRFEALSGRSLFCRDPGRRADFASLTAREYEDEMAQLRRAISMSSGFSAQSAPSRYRG